MRVYDCARESFLVRFLGLLETLLLCSINVGSRMGEEVGLVNSILIRIVTNSDKDLCPKISYLYKMDFLKGEVRSMGENFCASLQGETFRNKHKIFKLMTLYISDIHSLESVVAFGQPAAANFFINQDRLETMAGYVGYSGDLGENCLEFFR